jgi:tetratricopeptide (TPR) repeat protein
MRSNTTLFAGLAMALACTACGTPDFGHRSEVVDADQRLDTLLEAWRESRDSGRQSGGSAHIVVDAQRARNEIQRLAVEHPSHARTLMANAALAYEAREVEKSVDYLDRLFHLHTAHADAAVLRARIAVEQGNLPYAKRLLAQQIAHAPDHPGLREQLSATCFAADDHAGAASALDAAEQLGAPAWRVSFHRGLLAEAQGQPDEAARCFRATLEAKPDHQPSKARLAAMGLAKNG